MKKVLIANALDSERMLLETILKDLHYQVVGVKDGGCALELAQSNQFELVIADEKMPFIDGIDLTDMLRNIRSYKKTYIILTSKNCSQIKNKINFNSCINKPFNKEDFLTKLRYE